jgi:hypothetical protein
MFVQEGRNEIQGDGEMHNELTEYLSGKII